MTNLTGLNEHDLDILRRLASRKAAYAADPENVAKRDRWHAFDAGPAAPPMVLIEAGAIRPSIIPPDLLQCEDSWARDLEQHLLSEIFQFEVVKDDSVLEAAWPVSWHVQKSGYGVETVQHKADNSGRLGARRWDPPLKDLDRDFEKLKPQTFSVDRERSLAFQARMEAIFKGILEVPLRGALWWTMGMTIVAIDLVGLDNLMLYMYDNPEGLKRLMAFLCEDHLAFAKWAEREGILSLNNGNDYIGSGSRGFTRRLPSPKKGQQQGVRLSDMWVLLESQETVGVGPEQFEEFIYPFQERVAREFGLCYYGCCEPVNNRFHVLKRLPNLARISVSPWADEAVMARECGNGIAYSRKPNPALISTTVFDEDAIRRDIRQTLEKARGCRVELIMKDVHTVNGERERVARWVALARDEIRRARLG